MCYSFRVIGDVDDGFTSAEILDNDEMMGQVFELDTGWYVRIHDVDELNKEDLIEAIIAARDELLHDVNRRGIPRGIDPPAKLTRAGFSLWLMERDDGKEF